MDKGDIYTFQIVRCRAAIRYLLKKFAPPKVSIQLTTSVC